jgi:hypothetical protein
MYTAVILDQQSKSILVNKFGHMIEFGWELICHHMTINMKQACNGPASDILGHIVNMTASSIAKDNNVIAIGIETSVPSNNKHKHITFAVNKSIGAKAKQSNDLVNWQILSEPIYLSGTVEEVGTEINNKGL